MKNYTGFSKKGKEQFQKTLTLRAERSEQFKELLLKVAETKIDEISSSTQTSEAELFNILEEISKDRKCNHADAFKALALLAQIGATSPRAQENVKVTLNKTDFKIGTIRNLLKTQKRTLRRLAKTYATEFKDISEQSNISGNLFNKINLHYPSLNIEPKNKFWYSDFQSDNPECPEEIRFHINTYYNDFVKKETKNKK
nr:hypothetical protein [Trentepohlia sp. YN1317]